MVKENKLINFDLYFCGFWKREHSGLCDDDKFQKRQKIQGIKIQFLTLQNFQVIFYHYLNTYLCATRRRRWLCCVGIISPDNSLKSDRLLKRK